MLRHSRKFFLALLAAIVLQACGGGTGQVRIADPAERRTPVVVNSLSPASGPVGTVVRISGSGFSHVRSVLFNGTSSASVAVVSDTQINAVVPGGASTGPVSVTTNWGTASSPTAFSVTQAATAPQVSSFLPATGPPGTAVTIVGKAFTGANVVRFNGMSASFCVVSDSSINATVPAGASTGPISVTTSAGTGTSSTPFTVSQTAWAPQVTSFSPTSGTVGTAVTLGGTGFTGATSVAFNGVRAATFAVVSNTQITTVVPGGASTGAISVTTPAGTGSSAAAFSVVAAPQVTSFSPISGTVGTAVTLGGTGLTGATSVTFNGVRAATFAVVSNTQITTVVPGGASTGAISVTTPAGTSSSAAAFSVVAAPQVTSFSPTSGTVGTAVTLGGTGLTGATSVAFNGVRAATFAVVSNTQIATEGPGRASTGAISVTTPAGTGSSAAAFSVIGAPQVTSFSPTSGPVGTSVTITGSGFTGATEVMFN